jgi:hypothetical protein
MKLSIFLVGSSLLVATAAPSFGHDWYSGRDLDARQDWQWDRIQRARRSGELTGHEYRSLMSEQRRISEIERRAKSDGVLTWRERDAIRGAQQEAGRHIYRDVGAPTSQSKKGFKERAIRFLFSAYWPRSNRHSSDRGLQ